MKRSSTQNRGRELRARPAVCQSPLAGRSVALPKPDPIIRPQQRARSAMSEPLWRPDGERARRTQILAMARRFGFEGENAVARLWERSAAEPEEFWQAVWDLGQVRHSRPPERVLENPEQMPGARWFTGASLNF